MPGLLVSVRSADEATAALSGGATVIDIKEPARGPLGRAEPEVWQAVRRALPADRPVSAALGELVAWPGPRLDPSLARGLAYVKLGLAGAGPDWAVTWSRLRASWSDPAGPGWVAVVYADWHVARSPHPDDVLGVARETGCAGVLVDTWDKGRPSPLDVSWAGWVGKARGSGLFVVLAGGLDEAAITRLSPLEPDLFAVRGAACRGADRLATVDPDHVARLARLVASLPGPSSIWRRNFRASGGACRLA